MNPAWLGVIVPVAIAAGTALASVLTARRTSSGQVRTSDAEALWEQTRAMLTATQDRLARVEDQRDKLMDLQRDSTMPILEAISQSQKHVLGLLTELLGRMERSDQTGK